MTGLIQELGIDKLPRTRQLELAYEILGDSRSGSPDETVDSRMYLRGPDEPYGPVVLTEWQKAELDRRIADMEANPDDQEDGETVMARLRAQTARG